MKSTRKAYGEALVNIGKNKDVVVLDSDLSKATMTYMFKEKYPERHFNMGISEQDMMDTAAGLALSGKTVFASTFAMFAVGRAYDQVRNGIAYNNANVCVAATHSGITVGEDGATHQCIEDISLMRGIPNMLVISPSDDIQTKWAVEELSKINGYKYLRLGRCDVPEIYNDKAKFEIGKAVIHGNGNSGTIFSTGYTVHIALEAKRELEEKGIFVTVVDMHTIKPIDKNCIINQAKNTDKLISIEDHSIIGGLGTAICEVLCSEYPKKLIRLGVQDKFGKSGNFKKLLEMYNITKEEIIKQFE